MTKPPTGHYRKLLPANHQDVKLAFTDQPMTGVVRRPDLVVSLVTHFKTLSDSHAAYYAEGLRDGTIIPVTVAAAADKIWAPGELFLTS